MKMLPSRLLTKNLTAICNALRKYSSDKYLDVNVNDKTGVATVTMQKPPVNSLDTDMLTALADTFKQLERSKIQGVIITSALNKVFCAGLDINEMIKPDKERLRAFRHALQEVWVKFYGSSYPTTAVINGHAPAGGCFLALCAEYRVMLKNFTIGLNETKVGLDVPQFLLISMKNAISTRDTELAVAEGRLFTTEEALKIGLVDETAEDSVDGLVKAEKYFQRFAKVHPLARQLTKMGLRGKDIEGAMVNRNVDIENFVELVCRPDTQQTFVNYMQGLKKRV